MRASRARTASALGLALASALGVTPSLAHAEETPQAEAQVPVEAVDLSKDTKAATQEDLLAASPEAPPPAPYKKSLVLDAKLGAIGFLGQFGKIAPPGPWMHVQLGYELLKWLMVYGEGELAFTDTSNKQKPPNTRAFAMFGFGGGARLTMRFTDRVGVYAQGGLGMLKADVPTNALGLVGFRDAESLGVYLGGRLGVEWYQINRHFALGLDVGLRSAQGFAKTGAAVDTPLVLDGSASLRYAF